MIQTGHLLIMQGIRQGAVNGKPSLLYLFGTVYGIMRTGYNGDKDKLWHMVSRLFFTC